MSKNLTLAQNHAWNLAKTLMVCVVLFRGEEGFGVLPSDEFDGEAGSIIHEYDPFEM